MDMAHLPQIAICTACSLSNSVNRVLERLIYGRKIDRTPLAGPPVFILGHWRSGTTFLHNLLAEDQRFVTPNTYQIINPHHFLLTESTVVKFTQWLLPKTRPMDNMKVTWESPQEDETALLNLTLTSAYLMLAFQGKREYYNNYFDMRGVPPNELQRWKDAFVYLLKKLTVKSGRQVLLKSPTHTYRIPLLLEMFPDAYFVNIVRNPYAVYNSSIHMRKKMFAANGLANFPEWDMEDETCLNYTNLFERYHADRELIPADRLYEIKYEELERNPIEELRKVYDHFGWYNFGEVSESLDAHLKGVGDFKKNEFDMPLDLKRRIYQKFRPMFERYGYPSDLDETSDAPDLEPAIAAETP